MHSVHRARSCLEKPTWALMGSVSPGGGGVLSGYVPLVCHNPYAIIVNSVANYRLRISHF